MADSYQLIDADSGMSLVPRLQLATTFWQRFRGLQFRKSLASDQGLLIVPCKSVHTHWMSFSIDIAMLNGEGVVVEVMLAVKPWRAKFGPAGTHAVLETAQGTLSNLAEGTRVHVVARDSTEPLLELFPTR